MLLPYLAKDPDVSLCEVVTTTGLSADSESDGSARISAPVSAIRTARDAEKLSIFDPL